MIRVGLSLIIILCLTPQTFAEVSEVIYTEDLAKFKSDNVRGRMEQLLGCWLMAREYTESGMPSRGLLLSLIKKCMMKISRRDSVVKITALVGKNAQTPKTYQQIVPIAEIPSQSDSVEQQLWSEFDHMVMEYVQGYEKDLSGIKSGQEGEELKKRLDEELAKRQKYYLGFIPANRFTHILMLISIALILVAICSCWKYYKSRDSKDKTEEKSESYFKKAGTFTKSNKPKKN